MPEEVRVAGPALAQPFLGFIGQLVEEVANIANFTPIPVAISGSPYLSLLLNPGRKVGLRKRKTELPRRLCLREHEKNHHPKILFESAIDVEPGI